MPDAEAWIVREGQDVLGNDGKKIGEVTGSAGNTLVVKHGRLFTSKELYVPASAIASIDREAIHLNVSSEIATGDDWRTAPPVPEAAVPNAPSEQSGTASVATSDESWTISEGMNVLGADGERIGEVTDGDADAISVRIGRLFSRVVSIAAYEIADVRDQVVHVRTTRAALEHSESATPAPASGTEAATTATAAPVATSTTPFSDLQGRIMNAWRNVTGPSATEATPSGSEAAPVEPAPSEAVETVSTSPAPTDLGAGFPDLPSDPIAHQEATPVAESVEADGLGVTEHSDVLTDLPGDTDGITGPTSTEATTTTDSTADNASQAGIIDSLRTRLGDLLDRPTPSASTPPASESDAVADAEVVASSNEAVAEPAPAPGVAGVFESVRSRVSSFIDKPAVEPAQTEADVDGTAADTATPEDAPQAKAPAADLRSILNDVKGRVTSFLDQPATPPSATDESPAPTDGSEVDASQSTPPTDAISRFAVVSRHDDGDGDDDLLPAAPEDGAAEATAGSDAEGGTAEAQAALADTAAPEDGTSESPAVESVTEPASEPDTTDSADAQAAAEDEAITLDALAAESPVEGVVYQHVDDRALVDESPEAELPLEEPTSVSAATEEDSIEPTVDEADGTLEANTGTDASGLDDIAVADTVENDDDSVAVDTPVNDQESPDTNADAGTASVGSADAAGEAGDGGPESTQRSESEDEPAAPEGEHLSATLDAGDTTIAGNAATGTLANAENAVASATGQDGTIASNALHGTLTGSDSLARSWTAGAAAATQSGAEALASDIAPIIESATPLADDPTPAEADAVDAINGTTKTESASDEGSEPSKETDAKLGPTETEGIDWVAAVEGEDPPHGWTVKGNANSGLYHTTESRFYERTIPEIWFPNAEAAERVGYQLPKSMRHAGSETASAIEHAATAAQDATDEAS